MSLCTLQWYNVIITDPEMESEVICLPRGKGDQIRISCILCIKAHKIIRKSSRSLLPTSSSGDFSAGIREASSLHFLRC
jgi:hypothetical protein